MKSEEQLLSDVIRDAEYERFQRELLGTILHEARRKRMGRTGRAELAMAAVFVLASALLWSRREPPRMIGEGSGREAVINSAGLEKLPAAMVVRSAANAEVVRSSGGVEVVRTADAWVESIGDGELLAMFRDEAVALVGSAPGERRLVVVERDLHGATR
jgi:hypothetical protein